MDIKELEAFFADKAAEVSIDFTDSETDDVALKASIALAGEEFISMKYDLPFEEADGFISELQQQVNKIRGNGSE